MLRLLWLFLIITRLRDRLRCPVCSAVGTYKPHAPGDGRPWRWMCKWCGFYKGPEGMGKLCCPSPTFGCWIFKDQQDGFKGATPEIAVEERANFDAGVARRLVDRDKAATLDYKPWPWRG